MCFLSVQVLYHTHHLVISLTVNRTPIKITRNKEKRVVWSHKAADSQLTPTAACKHGTKASGWLYNHPPLPLPARDVIENSVLRFFLSLACALLARFHQGELGFFLLFVLVFFLFNIRAKLAKKHD